MIKNALRAFFKRRKFIVHLICALLGVRCHHDVKIRVFRVFRVAIDSTTGVAEYIQNALTYASGRW
jgi:hypothetical protein